MRALVSATYLYPIKACAPLRVNSLAFDPSGDIRGDRTWVVVDADGRLTWQGAIPTLSRIIPAGTAEQPAISSVEGESAPLPPPAQGTPCTVQSWNSRRQAFDTLAGYDAGDHVAELASSIAGARIRLVHLPTAAHRPNPAHIISTASHRVLAATSGLDGDLRRFRPNIVLSDDDGETLPPFAEERAAALIRTTTRARLELAVTAPCERCIVINVDPVSGTLDARYLKAVAAHSQQRGKSVPAVFGIYARATGAGTLATGDRVELALSDKT